MLEIGAAGLASDGRGGPGAAGFRQTAVEAAVPGAVFGARGLPDKEDAGPEGRPCELEGGNHMDGTIAGVFPFAFSKQRKGTEEKSVLKEIEMVRLEMESAAARYEFLNDPDLVEACIYEMKALTARHRYLLREAKKNGLKAEGGVGLSRTPRL